MAHTKISTLYNLDMAETGEKDVKKEGWIVKDVIFAIAHDYINTMYTKLCLFT